MILRLVLLVILACPALLKTYMPVVCPCTYVANKAINGVVIVAKKVVAKDDCDCSLPSLNKRETYDSYIQRVFSKQKDEPVENYFSRVYKQYKDESDEKYIERIDKIYSVFPKLDCKDNTEFWKYNSRYYTLKYGKLDSIIPLLRESNDQYFARILRREKTDDFNSYIKRLDCVFKAYPKLDIWRRIKFDSDTRNWYFHRHVAYNCAIRPSENEVTLSVRCWNSFLDCKDNTEFLKYNSRYYTLKYGKLDSIIPLLRESNDQYFARILRREKTDDFNSYIKRLDCVFKAYPKLDTWRRATLYQEGRIRESVAILYARRECEKGDDFSYFKRIVARLQGETDDDYMERLTRIRSRFGDLPLWYNCEFIDLTKNYYKLLYAKKDNESINDYYKRITTKSTLEDFTTYVNRIKILEKVFKDLPLWNNCEFIQFTAPFYNWIFAKKPKESNESYLKRITVRNPGESLDSYTNRLNVCRWVNRGTDLFYNRAYWPYIENYYENYFKKGKEEVEGWLGKVFKRDYQESDEEYVKRCDVLTTVLSVANTLRKINLPESALKYASDFYRLYYKRQANEDRESWLQRITKKLPIETDVTYQTRLRYLENIYTDSRAVVRGVLKRLLGSGKSCSTESDKEVEVLLVKKKESLNKEVSEEKTETASSTKKPEKKTIQEEIEEIYGKKKDEDEISWYKRITTKSPGETTKEYVKTLSILREFYPTIPLWYDKKNLDLVKEYYTCLYNKLPNESDEQYFSRIVSKEAWESWEQTAQRITLLQDLYPDLPLWFDEKYYEKFVKKIYEAGYKKRSTESDEEYIQRLLAKNSLVDTTTEKWAKKVHMIQLATATSPVWYDEKYFAFTKSFYEAWYKKDENEGCTTWLTRTLKPLTGESEANAIQRVRFIKQTTGNCGCWTEFTFKKVASSRCLSEEYLDDIENEFFDSATTYERIYSSSKSSARSESSSSEEESLKVVKKA